MLLVHLYNSQCKASNFPMFMSSPVKERAVFDIRATAEAHHNIIIIIIINNTFYSAVQRREQNIHKMISVVK